MELLEIKVKTSKIPVIYSHDNSLPIVMVRLVFKNAGSCIETKHGLAKVVSSMLGEGTKELGSTKFNRELDIRDISLSFSSGFETFVIEINCLKEHLQFALESLCSVFKSPNFTEETLSKIKTKTIGQIASLKTNYDYQASLELNKILYQNTKLQYPLLGDEESVSDISLSDVKKFFADNLDLGNLFVGICGDVCLKEIDFDEFFSALKVKKERTFSQIETSNKAQSVFLEKDTEQAYIYFGSPLNIQKDKKYLIDVALFVLGSSGFGSRLMEEIRVKRGLAYSAYCMSDVNLHYKRVIGHLQTKNESKEEAIKLVQSEFDKFVKLGVKKDELDQAKKFLLGSEPIKKETLFKRMNIAMNEFYSGYKLGEFDRNLNKIKNLNLVDLNDFINSHEEIVKLSFAVLYK